MWATYARRAKVTPQPGTEVYVLARPDFWAERGELRMTAVTVLPTAGVGDAQLELQRVKEALAKDGLFDPSRKRALPRFPRRVAIVTSVDGAALHDMVTVARRRWPARIVVVRSVVQGEARRTRSGARARPRQSAQGRCLRGGAGRGIEGRPLRVQSRGGLPCHRGGEGPGGDGRGAPDRLHPRRSRGRRARRHALRGHGDGAARSRRGARAGSAPSAPGSARDWSAGPGSRGSGSIAPRTGSTGAFATPSPSAAPALDRAALSLDALSPLKVLGRGYAVPRGADGQVLRREAEFTPGRRVHPPRE